MCIGLHTLPPCLLFCGNYILHESEYDVHIFCVALDIIIYLPPLDPVGGYAPATPFLSTIEVFRQTEIITLFLLFVIRIFAVGIFVFDEDFLYIFKLVLFLFLFHIRGVREVDRLVCFVIYMVNVTVLV